MGRFGIDGGELLHVQAAFLLLVAHSLSGGTEPDSVTAFRAAAIVLRMLPLAVATSQRVSGLTENTGVPRIAG